jgi:hypothetical protein
MRAPATLDLVWPAPTPRPITGAVELALAAAAGANHARPARVSAVIEAVFDGLAGMAMSNTTVRNLASGSRAWLLTQAAVLTGADTGWFTATCQGCGAVYDFPLRLAEMPRGAAGPGFPVAQVETSLGLRWFEVPNGAHEEALANAPSHDPRPDPRPDPRRDLVALLGLADTANQDAAGFTTADLLAIDSALDAIAPDIADRISASCPECGSLTEAAIDPLTFTLPVADDILRQTHLIARAYGWAEGAILALPSDRRRSYAGLIAADQQGRLA